MNRFSLFIIAGGLVAFLIFSDRTGDQRYRELQQQRVADSLEHESEKARLLKHISEMERRQDSIEQVRTGQIKWLGARVQKLLNDQGQDQLKDHTARSQ
jgi:hypothetical protein